MDSQIEVGFLINSWARDRRNERRMLHDLSTVYMHAPIAPMHQLHQLHQLHQCTTYIELNTHWEKASEAENMTKQARTDV